MIKFLKKNNELIKGLQRFNFAVALFFAVPLNTYRGMQLGLFRGLHPWPKAATSSPPSTSSFLRRCSSTPSSSLPHSHAAGASCMLHLILGLLGHLPLDC
jgi:hypothetical protein